jgi:hypothetical protein
MGTSRKKARLGWGQGLAKYEKAKVQGSVDSSGTRSGGPGDAGSSGAGDAGICGTVTTASCPSPVTPLSATSRPPGKSLSYGSMHLLAQTCFIIFLKKRLFEYKG